MPLAALAGRFGGRRLNAPLDVADGREVFIHAAAVGGADGAVDLRRLLADEIENAQVHHLALLLHDRRLARRLRRRTGDRKRLRGFTSLGAGVVGERHEILV